MGRDVGARRSTAIALISIGLVAVLVHGALAQRQKIPLVLPDEFLYGNYARSLANGDGLTWRGGHEGLRSLLYVFAIAPSWLVSSGPGAYAIAKGLGTLMMCSVAIPVWLLARRLLETPLALAATALALAGTWMTSTGLLLTENLALPLATASLAAMVAALQRPGSRWPWVALGLAAAATFTRLQLVVLVPILLLALLADVVRQPRGERRARLEAHRAALVVVALLTLAGLVVVAADHGALGLYREVADYRPGVGDILANTAQYGLGLIALLAAVPAAATLALACRGSNWRDDRVGPLLIVVLVATVVMLVQSGIFGAGFGLHWAIDRYVSYVAPLALVLMLLAPGRISTPVGIGIAVLLALALLAADPIGNPFEQRSTYALSHEIHGIASGLGRGAGLAILAGVVGVAGIWLLGRGTPWATLGCAGLVLVVLGAETGGVWDYQISNTNRFRDTMPAHLDWVDRASDQPVAMVMFGYENPRNYVTELFNERIADLYRTNGTVGVHGRSCLLAIDAKGALSVRDSCSTPRRTLLLVDPFERVRFHDERLLAQDPGTARLVRTAAAPRALSAISDPCVPHTLAVAQAGAFGTPVKRVVPCEGAMQVFLWSDEAGTLVLRTRGGSAVHYGRVGDRVLTFPAAPGEARIPVEAGAQRLGIQLDWSSSAGAPVFTAAELRTASGTQTLLTPLG